MYDQVAALNDYELLQFYRNFVMTNHKQQRSVNSESKCWSNKFIQHALAIYKKTQDTQYMTIVEVFAKLYDLSYANILLQQ